VKKADEALRSLFAVLTFPLGWLRDEASEQPTSTAVTRGTVTEHKNRFLWRLIDLFISVSPFPSLLPANELQQLRRMCVPQAFLMCHTVLHETGQYHACLELANLIADEVQALYVDFATEELQGFLSLLHKSALAAVTEG